MAKAIWQGTISFGLVEIPVALQPAEKPHELDLTMLDRRDFSPVGYRRYNKTTGEEVAWADIVRGYEHEKGEYVVLGDEDLRRANPDLTKTIEILRFVDPREVEPALFEKPYYLAPLKKRGKAYALLRQTLEKTKTVGVARLAIRTREHIALIGVREGALIAYLLRYPDEIRPAAEIEGLEGGQARVTPREVRMATKLVEDMTERWDPEDYEDSYAQDVLGIVEQKVKSGNVHEIAKPMREKTGRGGQVIDLMPLLKQSLEGARKPASLRGKTRRSKVSARTARTRTSSGRRRTA